MVRLRLNIPFGLGLLTVFAAFLCMNFTGCSGGRKGNLVTVNPTPPSMSSLAINLIWPENNNGEKLAAPQGVVTVEILVSASDMATITNTFNASTGKGTIDNVTPGQNRTVTARGMDSNNKCLYYGFQNGITLTAASTTAITIQMTTACNDNPVISAVTANPEIVSPGGTSTLTCQASDPNDDALTYSWTTTGGTISSTSEPQVTWTHQGTSCSYTLTCTATDNKGGNNSKSITISVPIEPATGESAIPMSNDYAYPKLVNGDLTTYLLWSNGTYSTGGSLWMRKNDGCGWSDETLIASPIIWGSLEYYDVTVSNGRLHATYLVREGGVNGTTKLYYFTPSKGSILLDSASYITSPSISAENSRIAVSYWAVKNSQNGIFYFESSDQGNTWTAETIKIGNVYQPSLIIKDNVVHLAFIENFGDYDASCPWGSCKYYNVSILYKNKSSAWSGEVSLVNSTNKVDIYDWSGIVTGANLAKDKPDDVKIFYDNGVILGYKTYESFVQYDCCWFYDTTDGYDYYKISRPESWVKYLNTNLDNLFHAPGIIYNLETRSEAISYDGNYNLVYNHDLVLNSYDTSSGSLILSNKLKTVTNFSSGEYFTYIRGIYNNEKLELLWEENGMLMWQVTSP